MINYKSWNYRTVPMFKEEFNFNNTVQELNTDYESMPSIEQFKEKGIYEVGVRNLICSYLENCAAVLATSFKRCQPYSKKIIWNLEYYTDGEVIFNNLLFEYIKYDDFAVPVKWFTIMAEKNFVPDSFQLNFDLIIEGKIDIFSTAEETFENYPSIRKFIL